MTCLVETAESGERNGRGARRAMAEVEVRAVAEVNRGLILGTAHLDDRATGVSIGWSQRSHTEMR